MLSSLLSADILTSFSPLQRLLASKSIYSIAYLEKKKTILFPVIGEYSMHVDHDLKEMWNAVQMPKSQVELEEKLHAAGHLSDTQYRAGHLEKSRLMQAQIKLAAGQKLQSQAERRANRKRYPQKLTNTHLIGQYEWSDIHRDYDAMRALLES